MKKDIYYEFKLKLFAWLDEASKNVMPENVSYTYGIFAKGYYKKQFAKARIL